MTKGVTDACPVAGFDITTPNAARIYNYWLGGKDHFLVDREAAKLVQREFPHVSRLAKANRRFLVNAVRFCVEQGITQLIDVGMGIPVSPTVIDIARKEQSAARMVGVDNDPVVLAHNRALVETSEGVRIIEGDVRQPQDVLTDPVLHEVIDLDGRWPSRWWLCCISSRKPRVRVA
jgi:S-adenosyl methyltransferase